MRYALLFLAAGAFAGGLFDAPYRGCIQDRSGVRFVYGLRSSFVVSDAVMNGATASACAADRVVVKMGDLMAISGRDGGVLSAHEAPSGPALFAFGDNGDRVIAYFPEHGAVLQWDGAKDEWSSFTLNLEGTVLAIAAANDELLLLHRRFDRLWLTRTRAEVLLAAEPVAGTAAAALLWSDGSMLLAGGSTLRLRKANGEEQDYEVTGEVSSLAHMGDGWVHVEAAGGRIAMERTPGGLRQYFLAGGAQ
jgi:hypothetical protein